MKPLTMIGIIGILLITIFSLGAKFSVQDLSQCNFSNITTATNTYLVTGSGFLHALNVNTRGSTSAVCRIYDSTSIYGSPTQIGVVDLIGSGERTHIYDVLVTNGLTIVTEGTMGNISISWR